MRRLLLVLAAIFYATGGSAQETVEWTGFLEPETRAYVAGPARWTDSSKPDARTELHLYPTDTVDGLVAVEADLRYADVTTPEVRTDLREVWLRGALGSWTLSVGKQLHNWSAIDEFGVVDVLNPEELPDLAQTEADRKIGVWTLKMAWEVSESLVVEGYLLPWFAPAVLPFGSPFAAAGTLPRPVQRAIEADADRLAAAAADAEARLDATAAELIQRRSELEAGLAAVATGETQLEDALAQVEAQLALLGPGPDTDPVVAATRAALEAQRDAILAQLDDLHTRRGELARGAASLERGELELAAARAELARRRETLERDFKRALTIPIPEPPAAEPRNLQGALRVYAPLEFGDFALAAGRLFDQIGTLRYTPATTDGTAPPRLRLTYPEVLFVSLAAAIPIGPVTLRIEELYLHTADADGTDPFVRNPSLQSAVQLMVRFNPRWQLRLGLTDEQILEIDDPAERADEESLPPPLGSTLLLLDHHIAHAILTWRFSGGLDQLSLGYAAAYENDGHFLAPELDWGLTEGIRLKVGAQIFAGPRDRSFGALNDFDNVYASLRMVF